MSKTRRQYTTEFRMESVRLMVMDGLSTREASDKLGVSVKVLGRWKRDYLDELKSVSSNESALSAPELAEELSRVRKQLSREQRINEILKKTVGYFARDEQ
jgi:transposase